MQITFVQKLVIKTELNTVQIAEEKKNKINQVEFCVVEFLNCAKHKSSAL